MGSVDDRTFRANFSADGVAKLRETVKDKLKEFMGDYTDDTLVEYVIVLLRNGRRKDEARNELNVFLGDDSNSFVSWLWDHLASSLDLYVHTEESHKNAVSKTKPTSVEHAGSIDTPHLDSESERGKSNKLSRSRHGREWKGLVRDAVEPPPLRSSEVNDIHFEEKTVHEVSHVRKCPPLRSAVEKKRSRLDERQQTKKEVGQSTFAAPQRLLQFAVRDAVETMRPSTSGKEPTLKRLRSVVSTSSPDTELVDRPRRIRSVATVPNPLATVIRAVAEAAEDVTRVKSARSVFDRLGHDMDVSEMAERRVELREASVEDEEYGNFNQVQEKSSSAYVDRHDYSGDYVGNMMESDNGLSVDSISDSEGYGDVNLMGHRVSDVCQPGSSGGNKDDNSLLLQYSVAKNAGNLRQITRNRAQDQPILAANTSRKIVNMSANVNTWKPSRYQESRDVTELESQKFIQESEASAGKSGVQLMEKSNQATVGNGNVKPVSDPQRESQRALLSAPGSYPAVRPSEDADSRTVFVNNVHFAATKDSLSRHFNKFGEVLKVVIVTDAATGQPKGSAYVEFMRKEAADNALTLDGTSFMSRILKVVKRNSAHQDAAPLTTWPRIARGSPYAAGRFTRASFTRGIPGAFRARLHHIKPGARSLQWKRDAQATSAESGAQASGSSVLSPTARSLTYVRAEPKVDGNSSTN